MVATDAEAAWLAGIIEGEGCIQIATNLRSVSVTVAMTDLDIIERLDRLFPCPSIRTKLKKRPDGSNYKPQFEWRIRKAEQVRELLELIMPWLGERRRTAADAALRHLDTRPGAGSYHRNKTHCRQGHAYDEANTYVNPQGHRSCRSCGNNWQREYVARVGYRWLGDPRSCPVCGVEFRPTRRENRTCSVKCGTLLRWETRRANSALTAE